MRDAHAGAFAALLVIDFRVVDVAADPENEDRRDEADREEHAVKRALA